MPYKVALLIALLVLSGMWFSNHRKEPSIVNYQVYYHQDGQAHQAEDARAKEIHTMLTSCLLQTNDQIRLLLNKEGLQKIFTEGEAWEIIYDEDQECNFGNYGLEAYKKIIVPVKGYLSPLAGATKLFFIIESPKGSLSVWGCPMCEGLIQKIAE